MKDHYSDSSNPLGKRVSTPDTPSREILYPIERTSEVRDRLAESRIEMHGTDRWTCFELSWRDADGNPRAGIGTIEYDSSSPRIVESKSLKLYLGSYHATVFASTALFIRSIEEDLSSVVGARIRVAVLEPDRWNELQVHAEFPGARCIDSPNPRSSAQSHSTGPSAELESDERLSSHILRSLCPVTGQPDWGSVEIHYRGPRIEEEGVHALVTELRDHQGFHEEVCERIFLQITNEFRPGELMVRSLFLRRGGIDINPARWSPTYKDVVAPIRLARQ